MLQKEQVCETFEKLWKLYIPAILGYAQASKTKSKELKYALREDDADEGLCCVHVLYTTAHVHAYIAVCFVCIAGNFR